MKKLSLYLLLLVILTGLVLYLALYPIQPATATVPEPEPDAQSSGEGPNETLCHLAINKTCEIVNSLDKAAYTARSKKGTYPAMKARGVPTYTLISATFDQELDTASLTPETFFVTQGQARLAGSISYIPMSQMAVFQPAEPLKPATTYTATLSPEVRTLSGQPLGESWIWSFTTTSGLSPLKQGLSAVEGENMDNMNFYFGDIHSHTGYSDGRGAPAQAFATAKANGLDFFAVTEHGFLMSQGEWQDVRNQANAVTINGQFVGIPGFEYSPHFGHINVFGSDTYIDRNDPNYDTLPEFYDWLVNHPTAFGEFNHPKDNELFDWNFHDFVYYPKADLKMVLQELETADQFFLSLNKGWHVGTLKNHDTHMADWGFRAWMGVVASSLTRESLFAGFRARRTFFVSPSDANVGLALKANGYWMGSAIPNTGSINFTVIASDPDPIGKPLHIYIYNQGVRVAGVTLPSNTVYSWQTTVPAQLGHYYYAEAFYDGWLYPAYSSPIWVERPPLAEAGPNQTVAPGATVNLNGSGSDPDGDAVAYGWTQESGPAVSLNGANTAQPTFVAPSQLGPAVLRLDVTDPGGLTAFDRTTINITNKPILAIIKSGPAESSPNGTITYRLTVTNRGISQATQVRVTDTLPTGATYVSGGVLNGNVVSWSGLTIPPNGGSVQVSFVVATDKAVVNSDYQATCPNCIAAQGSVPVYTNWGDVYLPLLLH